MRSYLKKISTIVLTAIAIPVVIFEEMLWPPIAWLAKQLSNIPWVHRIENWVAVQPAWMIVILFFVPTLVFEPTKAYGFYLMAAGSKWLGITLVAVSELIGTGIKARLLVLGKDKLLSYRWIAWLYNGWVKVRTMVWSFLTNIPAVRFVREGIAAWRSRRYSSLTTRFLAICRRLRQIKS